MQKWVNNGRFDGGQLADSQKNLRSFYSNLLTTVKNSEALSNGEFYELMMANERQSGFDTHLYIFLRYTDKQRILVVTNFNRNERNMQVKLPGDLLNQLNVSGSREFTDLLSGKKFNTNDIANGVGVNIPASGGLLLEF
jgi:glycosidase